MDISLEDIKYASTLSKIGLLKLINLNLLYFKTNGPALIDIHEINYTNFDIKGYISESFPEDLFTEFSNIYEKIYDIFLKNNTNTKGPFNSTKYPSLINLTYKPPIKDDIDLFIEEIKPFLLKIGIAEENIPLIAPELPEIPIVSPPVFGEEEGEKPTSPKTTYTRKTTRTVERGADFLDNVILRKGAISIQDARDLAKVDPEFLTKLKEISIKGLLKQDEAPEGETEIERMERLSGIKRELEKVQLLGKIVKTDTTEMPIKLTKKVNDYEKSKRKIYTKNYNNIRGKTKTRTKTTINQVT